MSVKMPPLSLTKNQLLGGAKTQGEIRAKLYFRWSEVTRQKAVERTFASRLRR